jgi:catechol 2,3-dioxygenase-like lactoylglutathione lyase family enzyme
VNRLHAPLKVRNIEESVGFYAALFGRAPDKREADYTRCMLEDLRADIAISARSGDVGVDHVGLQTDESDELETIASRLKQAGVGVFKEPDATCCCPRSDKYWTTSPDGAKWEPYRTFGDSASFGAGPSHEALAAAKEPCCGVV